jgi:hypothetical protein
LRRLDDGARPEVRQINLPLGARADQVLTGPWFDLLSTLDDDTLAKFDTHRDMLRRGVPESDAERRALEATLRERLGSFADNAVERLALGVAAEILDEMRKSYRDLSPQEREALKDRLREKMAARRPGSPVQS